MHPFFTISAALDYFESLGITQGDFSFCIGGQQYFSIVFDGGYHGTAVGAALYDSERNKTERYY